MSDIVRLQDDDPRMSQIVIHGGIVYLSGQVDQEATDAEGQTKGILAKIDTLLAAAGTDKSKLISAQIWVKDISQHFKPMNKVWCAWLDPKAKPVRATVEANLALPNLLVEIQVTCAV
uniref:RidA family protein n=1 Tax=Minutocellus polymorphus TaxID=265543 RepID=A0A7S0FSY1_9STRA